MIYGAEQAPKTVRPRRARLSAEERRARALDRYAELVYDTDRDYDVEFSDER